MQDGIPIEREDGIGGGRYVIHFPDSTSAELTYRKLSPGVIALDHTGVPPEHRGSGIALELVMGAIADARAERTKILPYCSYVVAQFRRHPDWSDLLAR